MLPIMNSKLFKQLPYTYALICVFHIGFTRSTRSNSFCTTDKDLPTYVEKLDDNSPFPVRCDNEFTGVYREHMARFKSKIVLGNRKSYDISIIPTKREPQFGTGKKYNEIGLINIWGFNWHLTDLIII